MLIALQEDGVDVLWSLFKNKLYETGQMPPEMLKCVSTVIPKNLTFRSVKSTEIISLMACTLELLPDIVLRRIRRNVYPNPSLSIWFHA